MKMIIAYIRPSALGRVTEALREIDGLPGMSVMEAKGFGRGREERFAEVIGETNYFYFAARIRIELMVPASIAGSVVENIRQHAWTGEKGEGKIFILPLEDAVRIRTNERGEAGI